MSRKDALLSLVVGTSVLSTNPEPSSGATDPLFRTNPLTNPFLEKVRIWEQSEADDLKYGGELAPGTPPERNTYAKLLVPILRMNGEISEVADAVVVEEGIENYEEKLRVGLLKAKNILGRKEFDKIEFKKVFNAFADNIYYSDPDRANAYLGGGATPKPTQSLAYLLRNEVLTSLEDLRAEVDFVLSEMEKKDGVIETEDLNKLSKTATDGMVRYLELVPPDELKAARDILAKGQ